MTEKKVTILLPTYNEANNVPPLLRALNATLLGTGHDYEILIIDDSNDNTPRVIHNMMTTYPEVRLIHREEKDRTGLATAFVEGFKMAEGEYILCMDSDLQHPPEVVPRLIEAIKESGNDVIVATRYRSGGGADGLGTLYRKFASHVCRVLSWIFLPQTRKTTDPGSGFFIMKKELIADVSFGGLRGFKILVDILSRTPWSQVSEVPYVFRKRENEESKATLKQGYQFILHLLHLRKQTIALVRAEKKRESESMEGDAYTVPVSVKKNPLTFSDAIYAFGIALVGYGLIGYYLDFKFLYTGYEDWIYHAFRVQSLSLHGMPSWDHVWSNGVNYWHLYQYIQHYAILGIVKLTGLPITTVFIGALVTIYIGLRLAFYLSLRLLGVSQIFSITFVLASYTLIQEWGSMQDFSIYLSFAILPIYFYLWIQTFSRPALIYVLTAVTGALWILHPVLAFSLSILLGFLVLFSSFKGTITRLFLLAMVYLLSAAPFLVEYFATGYIFTNPIFKSSLYLSTALIPVAHGLSFLYWTLFVMAWILLVIKSHRITLWVKTLFFYCSFYLLLIYLGQKGFLPEVLFQFQFSRALPIIGFALVYCFAMIYFQSFGNIRSRGATAIIVGLMALTLSSAIENSSGFYVASATNSIEDPVATYFNGRELPNGSVYVDNVSQATYFAPQGIRYATSYNEHAQPHPYSTRLRILMRQSIAYTGLSQAHIKSVEDYATVLGIEYLFLPATSPLVPGLTEKEGALFEKIEDVASIQLSDNISVLRYNRPISSAFIFERKDIPEALLSGDIKKPTLHVSSYEPWDERIALMAQFLREGRGVAVPLSFLDTDRLSLDLSPYRERDDYAEPILLVNQSYDANWSVTNATLPIEPTPLRLMQIDMSALDSTVATVELKNSWSSWRWPVQSMGLVMIMLATIAFVFFGRNKNEE
jgi:dolichol-phosphate mannosyltransferase